jgi:hypothetical protein
VCSGFAGAESLFGTWSAPSLSPTEMPILIDLLPDCRARERIGDSQGRGHWTKEGEGVRIDWDVGWTGILRPEADGGRQLTTWKPDSPLTGPPDDDQPATRIATTGD